MTIVFDIIIVLASIYLITMFYCSFKKDVKQAHINVEKYNLDNNCKSYLSHIKGNQPTVSL